MYYSKDAKIQRSIVKNPYYKDPLAKRKQDLFDPHKIKEICMRSQQFTTTDEKMKYVVDELAKAYPGHISKPESWVWNYNGGGLAQLSLIHASLREYLAIWGTPVGNNGFSGRYTSDVYDFMFDGEMEVSVEGSTKKFLFKGGDCAFLPRGVAKVYSIKDNGWMIDYGRGYDTVVGMLPFGLGECRSISPRCEDLFQNFILIR